MQETLKSLIRLLKYNRGDIIPKGDRTGPKGEGPRTGRGQGSC